MKILRLLGAAMVGGLLAVVAGHLIGTGIKRALDDPTPGPGLVVAALGGLVAWLAVRVATEDRRRDDDDGDEP